MVCVGDGKAALQAVRDEAFDVALVDIVMPEMDGLETLKHLRAEPDPPQVIIITGNGTVETAITAMKLGAYDYMAKPYRMAEIDVLVRRAWEKHQLARENRYLQARLSRVDATPEVDHAVRADARGAGAARARGDDRFAGAHHRRVRERARRCSRARFIGCRGASARWSRRTAPCSPNACSTSSCSATSAARSPARSRARPGSSSWPSNGTLFIDDVGVLSPKLQSKLARALEHGSFFRVGGTQKVDIAVRLVTSSNRDLEVAAVATAASATICCTA